MSDAAPASAGSTTGGGAAAGGASPPPVLRRATWAFALSIFGLCTATIIPSIAALILAGDAERRIWASRGAYGGEQRIARARQLGKLGISLGIIFWILVFFVTQWEGLQNLGEVFLDPTQLRDSFPTVIKGFWLNIQIFVIAEILVLIWGLILAIFRTMPGPAAAPLRWFAIGYIDLFRGLPALVTIYVIGLGIPQLQIPLLADFSENQYAILALTIVYGAYVAEVYRSGIESIHWSQVAAARSLGLSFGQAMQFVLVPQAVRRIIPPLLNDFIGLQKDTALVNVLGTLEGFNRARIYSTNNSTFASFTVLALCFLAVTIPLARFTDLLVDRQTRRIQAGAG